MLPDAAYFEQNPWRRISASQVALYRRCPAQWACRFVDWHQEPRPAVMFAGVAIQQAVEDVLRMDLPEGLDSGSELHEWSTTQARARFEARWREQQDAFRTSLGSVGEWDLPEWRFLEYALTAIRLHAAILGRYLTGGISLAVAWDRARPEMPGRESLVIPEGWFQWTPDLIYSLPDGGRWIVDLKVGRGGEWLPKYEEQMRSYLWADMLMRPNQLPAQGFLWVLGAVPPVHPVFHWTTDQAAEFAATCREMIGAAIYSGPVTATPSVEACSRCPFVEVCPSREISARYTVPIPAPVGAGGAPFESIDVMPTGRRVRFSARVLGVGDPKSNDRGTQTMRVTLANRSGIRSYSWDRQHVERLGLRVGSVVHLDGLRAWSPGGDRKTMLFADRQTRDLPHSAVPSSV